MRVVDRAGGGLQVFDVWGNVSGYTDEGDGEQSWDFTRISGGSATTADTIFTGSIALDYGQSGDGVIIRSVIGDNTPRDSVLIWETSPISASNYTLLTRTGNLNGSFGVTTDRYGFGAKDNVIIEVGDTDTMTLGKDAGGEGLHGIHINSENRWYGNGQLQVGGVNGLNHFPSQTFDTSTEVWDSSEAYWNAPIQLGSDVYIDGGAQIAGDAVIDGTLTVSKLDFQENGRIIGSNLSIDANTTFTDDVTIKGTLDGVDGTFSGTLSAVDGTFSGTLSGVDGTFSGELQAVTGTFGNASIASGGQLTGSNWLIDENNWVHPSLGSAIISHERNAEYNISTTNVGTFNREWGVGQTVTGSNTSNQTRTVKRIRWRKRFGINKLVFSGVGRRTINTSSGIFSDNCTVIGRILGVGISENFRFTSSSNQSFTINLDVSGLGAGTDYIILIEIDAEATGDPSNSGTDSTEVTTFLREDIDIEDATQSV